MGSRVLCSRVFYQTTKDPNHKTRNSFGRTLLSFSRRAGGNRASPTPPPPLFICCAYTCRGAREPPNAFTRAPHHISALSALQALSVTMISSSNPLTCSGDAGKLYFRCARRARNTQGAHQVEMLGGLFASLGLWWANLSGWHRWHLQGARLVQ